MDISNKLTIQWIVENTVRNAFYEYNYPLTFTGMYGFQRTWQSIYGSWGALTHTGLKDVGLANFKMYTDGNLPSNSAIFIGKI